MIRTTKENQDDEGNGTSFRNELHQGRILGESAGGAHPTPTRDELRLSNSGAPRAALRTARGWSLIAKEMW